jgi:hypothetical protein
MFRRVLFIVGAILLAAIGARSQNITIDGVVDRTTYNNSVSLRVQTNVGFSYAVTLNGAPIAAGIFHTINRMDYYDLTVSRTNTSTLAVTNALVRFIVLSSQRGDPERGLIQWVPLPPISSTAAEMAGAQLDLMAPQNYPAGLDIPIVARVDNPDGTARRVNGWVSAPDYESSAFRILRGVGFGLLPPASPGTNLSFQGSLQSLQSTKQINIESNTTWTTVSGNVGNTIWSAGSRIHVTGHITIPAGSTLTIGEGTVVRLNGGVNITNSGRTVINGTANQPVVFTATNRVAPEQHTGAWGGWFMRGTASELIANNAIMTGAGAAMSISFSPGSSHRSEQPVLFVHNATVRMTNCALVNNAGQIGNGYFANMTVERCIWQRAITVGEYEGCTNIIRNSALIEFPSVDGVYNAAIASADYDGYYAIRGSNFFANTLVGFCKDDAIDSGSGGAGTFVVSNCWIESALHEALAWSGEGRRTWTYNTVLINSGQGFECGWSTTNASSPISPIVYGSNLLSTANSVGARFGDNYEGTSGLGNKAGFLTVTNSFLLYNYRDVFGRPWDNTWNWRTNNMDIRGNFLSVLNTNHPANSIWNPPLDGWRLAPFMTTPADAPVGIGIAAWNLQLTGSDLTNGIPVRLSSFTTNTVLVDYAIETPSASVTTGTLTFAPGETVKHIFGNPAALGGAQTWRVALSNPSGGELTGTPAVYVLPPVQQTNAPSTVLIPAGSAWKYLDDGSNQGTAWRTTGFNDNTWSNGVAQLGFGDNDENPNGRLRRTNSTTAGNSITTFYFRRAFNVTNLSAIANLSMWMLRDDGGIVYLNDTELFRSPSMPPAPAAITYTTFANNQGSAPPDNTIDTATLSASPLVIGTNVVAVEIHQFDLGSSDLSFDFSLTGNPASSPPRLALQQFGNEFVLYWNAIGYALEQADNVTGPWTFLTAESPATVTTTAPQQFFRLRRL